MLSMPFLPLRLKSRLRNSSVEPFRKCLEWILSVPLRTWYLSLMHWIAHPSARTLMLETWRSTQSQTTGLKFWEAGSQKSMSRTSFAPTGSTPAGSSTCWRAAFTWDKVMESLRTAGYDGYLTAELSAMPHSPTYLYQITSSALDILLQAA